MVADARFTWDGRTVPISVAFGAHGLVAGEDPQAALAAADRAMYRQKRTRGARAPRGPLERLGQAMMSGSGRSPDERSDP